MPVSKSQNNPEVCRPAAEVTLDEIGPLPPPPPYPDPASVTCCGCIDIRTGVFVIVLTHLALSIFSFVSDKNGGLAPIASADILLSYILSGIGAVVLLVLLYAAGQPRWVHVYRRAAELNALLFVVSAVLSYVTVGQGSRRDVARYPVGWVLLVVTLVNALLGYWAWVLYKFTEVLEVEQSHNSEMSRASIV
ncbi:hypothetical protein BCR44DRAFT_41928 [Catenaria anguillulae PL171]|uniref:MARVEL domain-containing protein n=1 Tax=Catenaria anguillulae PL171 TaxID=765915 RepID=A0A1Y2HMS1_9FUNG|nr:hypothetical protein BCR44DRAFT_41928 [Catenaria anguillulae PL171]